MDRRAFLKGFIATAAGLLIPDWGQRIFPMYPRVEKRTIESFINYPGYRFVLELSPEKMKAYISRLRWEAFKTCDSSEYESNGMIYIRRSAKELCEEGWHTELKEGAERREWMELPQNLA